MKKYAAILALAFVLVFAMSGVAYANFGPHGGYSGDTDACAGCHRAHTSFSPIERTLYDEGVPTDTTIGSALLISSADTVTEFCIVCHGNDAPGASTNVEAGVFDSSPSGVEGETADGVSILYETNSSFDATLNGGGFDTMGRSGASVSSVHSMNGMWGDNGSNTTTGSTAPIWGAGESVSDGDAVVALTNFGCVSCHDPHGSSNYRLLKDTLPNGIVGGYADDGFETPEPFVISAEEGYPLLGWEKHDMVTMAGYRPNYTSPEYRFQGDPSKSISGWCAGCHTKYTESGTMYDYEEYMADYGDATPEVGAVVYYRHPVNTAVQDITASTLAVEPVISEFLPLEVAPGFSETWDADPDWALNDTIGCLTCHFAHGTTAQMEGWAEASLVATNTGDPSAITTWTVQLDTGSGGVNPNKSSALLRRDNRGVCERCHNK